MALVQWVENSFEEVRNDDFFDKIALVAHNCYQVSEKDHLSNVGFVERLVSSGHRAMVEHQRFLFEISPELYEVVLRKNNPFLLLRKAKVGGKEACFLSLSVRPLLEDFASDPDFDDIKAGFPSAIREVLFPNVSSDHPAKPVPPDAIRSLTGEKFYEDVRFVTYHLITDRGVTHELVRHRPCSFAQESTRYCNYTKDKFSKALTFMKPLRYDEFREIYDRYYQACAEAYFALIENGAKPDEARSVLPNSLKASIMVTCSITEWKHIFDLRCDEHAHPDIRRIMLLVQSDMKNKGYIPQ